MKYNITLGEVEAILNKLGGVEGVKRFLRGELAVTEIVRQYSEENGVIRFSVTSDGTTGPQWIKRLEQKGFRVGNYAVQLLKSNNFQPTTGVTYEVVVLKGELFKDNERTTRNIRVEADRRGLVKPNAEIACLIREKFTDKEIEAMGLSWIVTMHEPIKDFDGRLILLNTHRNGDGSWLFTDCVSPGSQWSRDAGFAFVSQVSAQA